MVAIRATTGRLSLSTTALALMDLNVSGVRCIANVSRFGRADCTASPGHPNCHFSLAFASMTTTAGAYYRVAMILLEIPSRSRFHRERLGQSFGGVNGGVVRGNYLNIFI